jgi:hypothetical protein
MSGLRLAFRDGFSHPGFYTCGIDGAVIDDPGIEREQFVDQQCMLFCGLFELFTLRVF